jgi:heparin binding hemagglutinin HbhA
MTDRKITDRKIPAPLYAAAGAGDLAYQELRKLSERLVSTVQEPGDLRTRVDHTRAELRARANSTTAELRTRANEFANEFTVREDLDKVREAAQRNMTAMLTGVHAAQVRANALYTDLIARGERVVRGAGEGAADAALKVAATVDSATDKEVTAAEAETAVTQVVQKAEVANAETDARIAKAKAEDATEQATKPMKRATRAPRATK